MPSPMDGSTGASLGGPRRRCYCMNQPWLTTND
jgi:hypothetical protein